MKSPKNSLKIDVLLNQFSFYNDLIMNTLLSLQKYKSIGVLGINDYNNGVSKINELNEELIKIRNNDFKVSLNNESLDTTLTKINEEFVFLFKNCGTYNFSDLLVVLFGDKFKESLIGNNNFSKFKLLNKFFHPLSFKNLVWKNEKTNKNNTEILKKNKIIEDFMIIENAETFECFDLGRTTNNFYLKVYGIKICIQVPLEKRTIIISGVVDDIGTKFLNDYTFIDFMIKELQDYNKEDLVLKDNDIFNRFIECLTLKEFVIFNKDELIHKYNGFVNKLNQLKQKQISEIVKEFSSNELFAQRQMIIQLLLNINDPEYQYLAYLLFDLLSNDNQGQIDTIEQGNLFDSLPWSVKRYFKDAMKQTLLYTKSLANFDENKIPLEQQICLMKVSNCVKEKAMVKLKEYKSKSEDSGSKARAYLEGLLKIPFGIYKEEYILMLIKEIKGKFNEIKCKLPNFSLIPVKKSYSNIEIKNYLKIIETKVIHNNLEKEVCSLKARINDLNRNDCVSNVTGLDLFIKINQIKYKKICHSGKTMGFMKEEINKFIDYYCKDVISYKLLLKNVNFTHKSNLINVDDIKICIAEIKCLFKQINNFMLNMKEVLDNAVYGHTKAKRQIERIVGQWINGEVKGYCFGFEGPAGVGKTSLSKKGIAECLKDIDGVSRPFTLIQIGGEDNGAFLKGHNYTYVGSQWGRIVDILIDTKCMNPIIFIDELDKISKTEHGRELIGILTHLVDPTQNDCFQDKYFSGIDIDLSRALFIFSYNDVNSIDRILLDRIHRIQFKHLTKEEKIVICNKFLLPEIYEKMGLNDVIDISEENLVYLIDNYTNEPGVRKLKEALFEIVGEINLELLHKSLDDDTQILPITISNDIIKNKYLKERSVVRITKIPNDSRVGRINGLWANAYGGGGIIPIECKWFVASNFELKLTGLQGEVMKESMYVAKTLAWDLMNEQEQNKLNSKLESSNLKGIHIHCPEGAVPKDGPSAGTAITLAIYSMLTNKKIKRNIGLTGEINLNGNITAIGGLDLKVIGGIRGGINQFYFPKENDKEFNEFMEKYEKNDILDGINISSVENIYELLDLVFE
jgi:hypothetical protein